MEFGLVLIAVVVLLIVLQKLGIIPSSKSGNVQHPVDPEHETDMVMGPNSKRMRGDEVDEQGREIDNGSKKP
ncbi:MAG: hypothetical protein ABW116_02540 [Candidatus Sedimenticola sp. 20ELBAFRAG]